MAAYAALVSLMNIMEDIQNHPPLSNSIDDCQIELLGKRADFFLDFMESYNSNNGDAQDLENQIASAAQAAAYAIESHVVDDQIHADSTDQGNCNFLLDLQKIIADMDSIKERVDMDSIKERVEKVKEDRGPKDQQPAYSIPAADSSRSTTIGETIMVGFDHHSYQLMDELTGHQSSRQIISIIGMGGIGKTTLAQNTFQKPVITRHFDTRAWVSVSHDYNVRQIFVEALSHLKDINNKVYESIASEGNEAKLGEQLYKSLSGRRYLIILDDMWEIGVWDKIKFFFPDNGNRSRIILTTRQSDVAIHCGSSCIRMNLLGRYEFWDLFCRRVFGHEDCPLELEQTGEEIVKLCRGLPLSITVIGGILQKSAKTLEYWKNVLENLKFILSSGDGDQCLKVLYSSYSHLPVHLKPCLLYMGTFKEDCEMLVSEIIKLWVGEGFVKPNGTRVLEEIAEDYLKDLVDRNLILIGESHQNGEIRSCHIHDLLRDLCISIAKKEKFAPSGRVGYASDQSSAETVLKNCNMRFISYNTSHLLFKFELPSTLSLIWNLQTLVFRGTCIQTDAPTEIWRMPQLRHVECNNMYLPDPPLDEFCVLRNLQTLEEVVNFRWSEEVCKRIPHVKKLRLIYDDNLRGYDDDMCLVHLQNLGRLQKLESVSITFPYCISRYPVDLVNKKLSFPSWLSKLCLRNCIFTGQDLATIGSLPHLQVLELEHASVWGGEWSSVNGEFRCLKLLRIDKCDLMYWTVDSSAFRVLEKLLVRDMWRLKEIPAEMGEINTLKLIHVHHCSESASISALEIMKEQESFGNDELQIRVNISFFPTTASFWERVKIESLPISIIRFMQF